MYSIVVGSILLSILHALIPNHWLPVLAIGRKESWTRSEISRITIIVGSAHAVSTILVGLILGIMGLKLATSVKYFTHLIAPAMLVCLGVVFIFRHHLHHHFNIKSREVKGQSKSRLVLTLSIAMLLSPCLEIQAYFLLSGTKGWWTVATVAAIYFIVTVSGMLLWVNMAYLGMVRFNWHSLEHNAGIITGFTLVATGVISYFIS